MTFYLEGLAVIVFLGVAAQWLSWRFNFPSILLLLVFGFLAGQAPVFLNPHRLFGNLLFPLISFSVAIILFEGGLNLNVSELKGIGKVVRNLITVGALVTVAVASVAARFLFDLSWSFAVLLGAILTVSGPTVIIPLIRHVRPTARISSILRWEGIIIDPVGAMLAVLVFEAIMTGDIRQGAIVAAFGFLKTILAGGMIGFLSARLLIVLLKGYWIPDYLHNPVTLTIVVTIYALSNFIQSESGLLAVTVMGITLANQKIVPVKQIIEFKENLRVLLIANLFIILASMVNVGDLRSLAVGSAVFLAVLILVARPVAVMLSSIGSNLSFKERFLISCVAPRGVVAAAVSSVFAMRLAEAGHADAELLVPVTFMVIVGTVVFYGFLAGPIASSLGLAHPHPQGTVIVGASPVCRSIASCLKSQNFNILLVDTNISNIAAARVEGLKTFLGNALSEHDMDEMELEGIGRLLAMTPNDEVNSLSALHFARMFGRSEVYQLMPRDGAVSGHLMGRVLFGENVSYDTLADMYDAGATVRTVRLTKEFDFEAFKLRHEDALPLFLINDMGVLTVLTADKPSTPQPGQTLVALVYKPVVPHTSE